MLSWLENEVTIDRQLSQWLTTSLNRYLHIDMRGYHLTCLINNDSVYSSELDTSRDRYLEAVIRAYDEHISWEVKYYVL